MNMVSKVSASFDKYGSNVEIINGENTFMTKGILQNMSYRNSNYYEKDCKDISSTGDMRYMLMTKADAVIGEKDIIRFEDRLYRVLVWQKYIVKNSCIYKWAILKLYHPEQEDDFSA